MSRPTVEHLVGTRSLHNASAVLGVPFISKIDNHSALLLESLAAMGRGAERRTWWVYRVSSWLYPSRPVELAVVDKVVQEQLDAQDPDFWSIRRAHVGHMALTTVGLPAIRIVANTVPAITTTEQADLKHTLLEVTLRPDDKAGICDISSRGTSIFADWSDAFASQDYLAGEVDNTGAKILTFPSKSTS